MPNNPEQATEKDPLKILEEGRKRREEAITKEERERIEEETKREIVENAKRKRAADVMGETEQENPGLIENARRKIEMMEKEENLLTAIDAHGRLAVTTVMTTELARDREVSTGFQAVVDKKKEGDPSSIRLKKFFKGRIVSDDFNVTDMRMVLQGSGLNAAVTLVPIEATAPVYREIEKRKWFLFGKEKVREQIGTTKEPIAAGTLTGNSEDQEPCYSIVFYVDGTEDKPYRDPTTRRTGGMFEGNIVLPETLAKEVFSQIERNPVFAKNILERLDPELMKSQRGYMPEFDTMAVVPEKNKKDAFLADENGIPRKIKPEYVRKESDVRPLEGEMETPEVPSESREKPQAAAGRPEEEGADIMGKKEASEAALAAENEKKLLDDQLAEAFREEQEKQKRAEESYENSYHKEFSDSYALVPDNSEEMAERDRKDRENLAHILGEAESSAKKKPRSAEEAVVEGDGTERGTEEPLKDMREKFEKMRKEADEMEEGPEKEKKEAETEKLHEEIRERERSRTFMGIKYDWEVNRDDLKAAGLFLADIFSVAGRGLLKNLWKIVTLNVRSAWRVVHGGRPVSAGEISHTFFGKQAKDHKQ